METKNNDTGRHLVQVDLDDLPPLTEGQKLELAALKAMPDADIDYSDAPYRADAVWIRVADNIQNKKQISLRVDADVLDFFKKTGKRYQTRMNAVLRSYFEAASRRT